MTEHKDWLRSCPVGDCNFKTHLPLADNEDILSLLSELPDKGNKTKNQVLHRELKRRKAEF